MGEAKPRAPRHLSAASKALWAEVVTEYDLELHHLRVLLLLCESLDRAAGAQAIIDTEGLVLTDRFGQPKPHVAVAIKRDAEVVAARLLRELNLLGESGPSDARLPRR